ncbi:hypothetical protein BDW22DRAFT_3531 [Trametopsis cervina]|nr:hypothetical protein BDW22DRAFT_3531 [Trametopsis cervina]
MYGFNALRGERRTTRRLTRCTFLTSVYRSAPPFSSPPSLRSLSVVVEQTARWGVCDSFVAAITCPWLLGTLVIRGRLRTHPRGVRSVHASPLLPHPHQLKGLRHNIKNYTLRMDVEPLAPLYQHELPEGKKRQFAAAAAV